MHAVLSAYPAEDQRCAGRQINGGSIAHGAVGKWYWSRKVSLSRLDASMPPPTLRIAIEDEIIFTGIKVNGIIGERLCWIKAEKEDEAGALES